VNPANLRWMAKRFDKVQEQNTLSMTVLGKDLSRALYWMTLGRVPVTVVHVEERRPRSFRITVDGKHAKAWKSLCEPYVRA